MRRLRLFFHRFFLINGFYRNLATVKRRLPRRYRRQLSSKPAKSDASLFPGSSSMAFPSHDFIRRSCSRLTGRFTLTITNGISSPPIPRKVQKRVRCLLFFPLIGVACLFYENQAVFLRRGDMVIDIPQKAGRGPIGEVVIGSNQEHPGMRNLSALGKIPVRPLSIT